LGQAQSAVVILMMVFLSAIMDFVNTRKSEAVAEKLVSQVSPTATVRRDGTTREVSLHSLVPGDIILLSAGDVIPADGRVLVANDFFVNQSSLTGESFPVEKRADIENGTNLLSDEETPDQSSDKIVFMGTSVVTGDATAFVLRTGARAEFGRIAERLSGASEETDFERGIKSMSVFIIRMTFVMVVVVFAVNAALNHGILNSLLFSIAIAVGLTPELLPVIMSVSLARGSLIMAKKEVIVKNLSSIQNFGGMDILCTDKTGTLTEDHIVLVKCVDSDGDDSSEVLRYTYLSSAMHTGVKSPLDSAIVEHDKVDVSEFSKVDEVPFDFHRRKDSMIVDRGDERIMICKGAPENVLEGCKEYLKDGVLTPLGEDSRREILQEFETLSADGFRVIGVAKKIVPKESRTVYNKEEERELVFIGFAAFLDPPKKGVLAVLDELEALHIEIKIVTGDSEVLTKKICQEISLPIKEMMTGSELDELSDSELASKAEKVTVFARVSPEQKERIVLALRKRGHVVGYMGDGINDAPVLKAADVGISVNNAVDVAKETADIILLTKSLSVLKEGVIEGRKTFQNTLKYIKMGFSSNFGNMFSMMGASAFLPFLPMLPAQILFNNFLYDMSQTTLSADNTDEEATKKPLRWDTHYFGHYIFTFGLVSSIFDFITFFMLYKVFSLGAEGFQTGWFIESIATQVLIVYIIRTKRVPFWKSMPSWPVVLSTLGIVLLAWIVPFTPFGAGLSFVRLPWTILCAIMSIVVCYLVVGEMAKALFYRWCKRAL
jgi:Mg2+-importing ATPase